MGFFVLSLFCQDGPPGLIASRGRSEADLPNHCLHRRCPAVSLGVRAHLPQRPSVCAGSLGA